MTKRNTDDDSGFDEQDAIVDHPDARPLLIAATLHDELGLRVFGPPTETTAALLDHLAAAYRKALDASRRERQ